jgi:aspartyl-tRNA(Asn)/glutamyl-tRNA(Gln) amidotransferase subunit A
MLDLKNLTIEKARKLLDSKEISVKDLVNSYLKNISEKNSDLNVYREIYSDLDLQIETAQKIIDAGQSKTLTGIPFSIKDNILIKGKIAGASSKILENYVATYNSTVTEKLLEQNAILLGRVNMDEFAMGGSTENSAYGVTKNPIDRERVSGGSSGGSAASVSGDMALASLGSDTGGSIRQPASFCGVVGLKPTYGSVSRHGLIAMASSLDVIGPITKSVSDSEIVFNVIKGQDKYDSTSVSGEIQKEVKTIGVPKNYLKGLDQDVLENFQTSLEKFKKLGYEIKDVELPNLEYSLAVYYVLMPAEVSSNMARFDGIKYGSRIDAENLLDIYLKTRGHLIGKEVKRRIILGTYVLSAGYADEYYKKAWKVRNLIKNEIKEILEKVDLLALPTSPVPAFKIGERTNDPIKMYLADIFTVFVNLAGVPAISIPDGLIKRENSMLPTGLQLIAPHFGEQLLFQVGKKFETI